MRSPATGAPVDILLTMPCVGCHQGGKVEAIQEHLLTMSDPATGGVTSLDPWRRTIDHRAPLAGALVTDDGTQSAVLCDPVMSKNHRLAILILLTALLLVLFWFQPTSPNVSREITVLLFSSLFLASFTALLLEHLFARPTDVIAAGVSILLLLVPSRNLLSAWGHWYWGFFAYEAFLVVVATVALLLLTRTQGDGSRRNRWSKALRVIATQLGPGKVQYFFLFFLTLLFYVEARSIPFIAFLAYGAFIVLLEPSRLAVVVPKALGRDMTEVGELFGVQGKNTFLARLHPREGRDALHSGNLLEFCYGMDEPPRVRRGTILERFFLDQSQWIRILSHSEIERGSCKIPQLSQHRRDAVYAHAGHDADSFLGSLVGVVHEGTDVATLLFLQVGRARVREGDLVQVTVDSQALLYQVVNAEVDTKTLESHNEADFVIGRATQLGVLDSETGTFERFGWVPPARTPVMRITELRSQPLAPDEITIGRVPGTDFDVVLKTKDVVSHHLAILGVTGVGKSVFARELIRKCVADDLRIIVVDFTREWRDKVGGLNVSTLISDDDAKPLWSAINEIAIESSKFPNQQDREHIKRLKNKLYDGFRKTLRDFLREPNQSIGVFDLPDVSNTEGVLEYTQWFFKTLFRIAREKKNYGRRVCVVLEEAHTVIPEWNFIGLSDKSSQALVNNISQIALQGRKYGVGFIVIAQRTASVSKTVLTQCNTVIAFQCFDGTSVDFLTHYLPRHVAESLPSLRSRRAVAVGKAIRGSVPMIFDIPDIQE